MEADPFPLYKNIAPVTFLFIDLHYNIQFNNNLKVVSQLIMQALDNPDNLPPHVLTHNKPFTITFPL